jgi:hypothetical protein
VIRSLRFVTAEDRPHGPPPNTAAVSTDAFGEGLVLPMLWVQEQRRWVTATHLDGTPMGVSREDVAEALDMLRLQLVCRDVTLRSLLG